MRLSLLYEDYHGGDVETGGAYPVDALARSQTRKGPSDLYIHPDDEGQAGTDSSHHRHAERKKSKKSKKTKKSNYNQ